MKDYPDNIEEKLVPFVEGVLTFEEKNEVRAAAASHPKIAQDIHDLQAVIDELREAFASGVHPPQESLTPEEVVTLASHKGGLESMPGSSELKTRLFVSDQALEEYRLLRALDEDMRRQDFKTELVPPISDRLLNSIRAFSPIPAPPVLAISKRSRAVLGWTKVTSFFDRVDPKPLMATAAAFVLLSLGVHMSTRPTQNSLDSPANEQIAFEQGRDDTRDDLANIRPGGAEPSPPVVSRQPGGVAVFTSADKALLNEQAQKLLANKVRYTVTEDRILVSEKEITQARKILWGEGDSEAIAMGENKPETRLQADDQAAENIGEEEGERDYSRAAPRLQTEKREDFEDEPTTPVTRYDYRTVAAARPKTRSSKGSSQMSTSGSSSVESAQKAPHPPSPVSTESDDKAESSTSELGDRSALRPKEPPSVPQWTAPGNRSSQRVGSNVPPPRIVTSTGHAQSTPVPGARVTSVDTPEQRRQKLREMALGDESSKSDNSESIGGESSPSPLPSPTRAESPRSRAAAQPTSPESEAPAAGVVTAEVERAPVLSASSPARATNSRPEVDSTEARVTEIRRNQVAVARKHDVVLSIESSADNINVYVRAKKELTKDELDFLRRAIREELGLAPNDSIIFR